MPSRQQCPGAPPFRAVELVIGFMLLHPSVSGPMPPEPVPHNGRAVATRR
jgi:hypothetical protein